MIQSAIKKFFVGFILLGLWIGCDWSDVNSQDLSHHAGVFTNVGYSARAMGLGGAYTALSDDVFGGQWNPAGLGNVREQSVGFFYMRQFALIPYMMAAYVNPFREGNWTHSEALSVAGDDALRETVLSFSMAHRFKHSVPGLRTGATLRYKNATFGNNSDGGVGQIHGSGVGMGLDLGVLYVIGDHAQIGFVLQNLIDFVSWNTSASGSYRQSGPMGLRIGIATRVSEDLIIAMDLQKSLFRDTRDRLYWGIERHFFALLSLRGGMNTALAPDANVLYHLGLGMQYRVSEQSCLLFDLAYLIDDLENTMRFSTSLAF